MSTEERNRTKKRRRKHTVTPWKRSLLRLCAVLLVIAGLLHSFRLWKAGKFTDQQEASRWSQDGGAAQVSAYLSSESALKEEDVRELEYLITQELAQDSIELASDNKEGKLWEDCYSAQGSLDISYNGESMSVSAVGTGGEYFLFHPLTMLSGEYYEPDSLMKDEVLIDAETAWKLFGSYDVVGRTLQIGEMTHTISGVFRKEEGPLYEQAGEPDHLIYVHYKTLLQYDTDSSGNSDGGSGAETDPTDTSESGGAAQSPGVSRAFTERRAVPHGMMPRTATSYSEGPAEDSGSETESPAGADGAEDGTGAGTAADTETAGSSSEGAASDNAGAGATSDVSSEESSAGGSTAGGTVSGDSDDSSGGSTGLPEGTGTSNTAVSDTGRITEYQIVMPDPVEGYAAGVLGDALGDSRVFKVVDNTNRYSTRSILTALSGYVTRGMRREAIRYPYWENYAVGWEDIFVLMFVTECLLCLVVILLLLIMGIHYVRHKTWTVAGNLRSLQDEIYERQSRRRYPEYYRDRDPEENEKTLQDEDAETSGKTEKSEEKDVGHRLVQEDRTPLRPAGTKRKAEAYEKKGKSDQYSDGIGAGTVDDSLRGKDGQQ